MDILLTVPSGGFKANRWLTSNMPYLGLGYIAAVLDENGIRVSILDPDVEEFSEEDIVEYLKKEKPRIVGLYFTTENRFEAFRTAELIRKTLPDSKIIAGGPHVSLTPNDTLKNINALDFIVRGEGEYTCLELVQAILAGKSDFSAINGLSYRRSDEVVNNPDRERIKDLDNLPYPARHLMPMDKYKFSFEVPGEGRVRATNIMTSRGCPFSCNFCSSSKMWKRMWIGRSPKNVVDEIEHLVEKYGVRGIWFYDDTLTLNKQRAIDICDEILKRKLKIYWYCEARVDTLDKPLLALMKKAGCFKLCFGVESGSQRILDNVIKKQIKIEDVKKVSRWCDELGISKYPVFIISHPEETKKELEETLSLIKELKTDNNEVGLATLHVYPGTEIEDIAKEKGIIPKNFSWSEEFVPGVETLPTVQGNVPIFIDKLSWSDISAASLEWAELHRNYSILRRIPRTIRSIRSLKDLKRYTIFLHSFIKLKVDKLMEE